MEIAGGKRLRAEDGEAVHTDTSRRRSEPNGSRAQKCWHERAACQ